MLTITVPLENGETWSVTFDEPDMLRLLDESSADASWSVSLQPVQDAAGIVIVSLICGQEGSDDPAASVFLEIYIGADGFPVLLSINGMEVDELPVD